MRAKWNPGDWITLLLFVVLFGICVLFAAGCRTYTVVAADREVVPVKQVQDDPRTYVETEAEATGWYVPDSIMLELLEAD